jgi:tetratricopeptide (TPR) repeat protein/O-antigen ligase
VTRATRIVDGAIEGGVLALLIFAPLPYGSIQPWAQVVIESGVALLLALSVIRVAMSGEVEIRLTPLLWPALAMAGLIGWQLVSPGGSVSPSATWESARLYGAYLGLLIVLSMLPLNRARVVRIVVGVVAWAVVLAGVGFARQSGVGAAWLLPHLGATHRLTSTFVNPNHQALYFSLALFLAFGLLLRPSSRWTRPGGPPGPGSAWPSLDRLPARVLLGGVLFVLVLAFALTLSRGGIVSAAAGLLAILALAVSTRARGRSLLPILAVVFGVTVYAGWVGLGSVAERFVEIVREPESDLRWRIWEATLSVVADAPLAGVGLGAYADGVSPYRPAEVPAEKIIDYAHNDFLQLLAETGLLGLLIALWALGALVIFTVRCWWARRDPMIRGLVLGGMGAVVAAMVHSLVDFGLHLPANAMVLVVVAALLPIVVTLHHDGVDERVGLASWSRRLTPRARAASVAAALLGTVAAGALLVPAGVGGWYRAGAVRALREVRQAPGMSTRGELVRIQADLRTALAWDPSSPLAWSDLAETSTRLAGLAWSYGLTPTGERIPDPSVVARLRVAQPLLAEAHDAYRASLRLQPRSSYTHERFGWLLSTLEAVRLAVRRENAQSQVEPRLAGLLGSDRSLLPEALVHLREAVRWDPRNAYYRRSLGVFALGLAKEPGGRELAETALREALTLRPDFLGEVIQELLARRVDDEFLLAATPRRFEIVLNLARELEARGRSRAASTAFEQAVTLAATPSQEARARLAYGGALLDRKEPAAALEQTRRALVFAPRDPEVFVLLSRVYAQTGQGTEAEVALTTAVALADGGPAARQSEIRRELATLLVGRGQGERAVAVWRQVLRDKPKDAWAHLELGQLLEQRGDATGALNEYRAAIAASGRDQWDLHWNVGRALRDAGYLKEAIASFEVAWRMRPTEVDLGTELGDLYARVGSTEQAIGQYRQVLRHEPGHPEAQRGLANMKSTTGS